MRYKKFVDNLQHYALECGALRSGGPAHVIPCNVTAESRSIAHQIHAKMSRHCFFTPERFHCRA
jgi:hypothetical protein